MTLHKAEVRPVSRRWHLDEFASAEKPPLTKDPGVVLLCQISFSVHENSWICHWWTAWYNISTISRGWDSAFTWKTWQRSGLWQYPSMKLSAFTKLYYRLLPGFHTNTGFARRFGLVEGKRRDRKEWLMTTKTYSVSRSAVLCEAIKRAQRISGLEIAN